MSAADQCLPGFNYTTAVSERHQLSQPRHPYELPHGRVSSEFSLNHLRPTLYNLFQYSRGGVRDSGDGSRLFPLTTSFPATLSNRTPPEVDRSAARLNVCNTNLRSSVNSSVQSVSSQCASGGELRRQYTSSTLADDVISSCHDNKLRSTMAESSWNSKS
jgi:hypothetical protein